MGHALASLLVENDGSREALFRNTTSEQRVKDKIIGVSSGEYHSMEKDPLTNQFNEEKYKLPENDMLESVLANNDAAMVKKYNLRSIQFQKEEKYKNHHFLKGMIGVMHEQYPNSGATSKYGSNSAGEMFAEAVADVYAHGSRAREMSIEFVKEYEKRGKAKARAKYNENKKSWWRRLLGL